MLNKNASHSFSAEVPSTFGKATVRCKSTQRSKTEVNRTEPNRTALSGCHCDCRMDPFFVVTFVGLLAATAALKWSQREGGAGVNSNSAFKLLQRHFLTAFLTFKLADWLMGPYFYEVYSTKVVDGVLLQEGEVAQIFLAGFLSSMLFGTFVGGIVDKIGRRKGCLIFGVLYSLSALSTHSDSYYTLILGRVCGGTATSLLFSAPESWLVTEHRDAQHPQPWLDNLFSWMYFGDGVVAIVAGIVASAAVSFLNTPTAPFDVSAIVLVVGTMYVMSFWKENYGNAEGNASASFTEAFHVLLSDKRILVLGLVQSLFESAMYIFVLLWVPVLKDAASDTQRDDLPLGLIFSCFMVCVMIGSTVFGMLMTRKCTRRERIEAC